jgi:hypothetical protein
MRSENGNNLEKRVSTLEGELKQFIATTGHFIEQSELNRLNDRREREESQRIVFSKLDSLSTSLNEKTAPNMMTLATWAGVVVAVILGTATPILYGISESANRDRSETAAKFEQLDTKLQREFTLALETQKEGIESLGTNVRERHSDTLLFINRLESELDDFKANGTPGAREKISQLQTEIDSLKASQAEFIANGSPALRERIARLEERSRK